MIDQTPLPKMWHIPAGVTLPVTRMTMTEPNAIWLRDYQDNKSLISQAVSFLADVSVMRIWEHEVAVAQEMDAEHQHQLRCQFDTMVAHFEMDGRV